MRFDADAYFADGGHVQAPSQPIQAAGKEYSPREVRAILAKLASLGINKDKIIAQINPHEAAVLRSIGGSGKVNPRTGLLSFDDEGGDGGNDGTGDGGGQRDARRGTVLRDGAFRHVNMNVEVAVKFPVQSQLMAA